MDKEFPLLLSGKDLKVMHILWKSDEPLTSAEIYERINDPKWRIQYLYISLRKLVSVDYVEIVGKVTTSSNLYSAKFDTEKYCKMFLGYITDTPCENITTDYLYEFLNNDSDMDI